jgi:UbiD family decarboxylase
MAIKDLREYIKQLEAAGEIQRIEKEVDWNLEIGAIIRRGLDLKAPAPFFQKIKGSPTGYRLFASANAASGRPGCQFARAAITLGLPPDISPAKIVEEYSQLMQRDPIKPVLVPEGPCQEVVFTGDNIDLLRFPTPYFHEGDGGRYIGTWHSCISKDPDTGVVNWGMYRTMLVDKNHLVMFWHSPQQHMYVHYNKYKAKNQPMPFAIAIGTDPVTPWFSGGRVPLGTPEPDVIGGVLGEPMQLVKAKT